MAVERSLEGELAGSSLSSFWPPTPTAFDQALCRASLWLTRGAFRLPICTEAPIGSYDPRWVVSTVSMKDAQSPWRFHS